jgi:Ca2+-binding RTX toxin-like protein
VNRNIQAVLIAGLVAVAALPPAVGAENVVLDDPAGDVNLAVADVVTGGVNITSPTTATVTANIDPNSVGTEYYFEYGPNGNLALRASTVSLGASPDPRQAAADLVGIEPGAVYEYRAVAAGPGGLSIGRALSFRTASPSSAAGPATTSRCTIRGTSKNDVLRGTRKRDVICGLGGRDRIFGLGGDDVIRGGAGNDRVMAGAGRDRVSGNPGNDALYGQAGADRLYGGKGRDRIVGGRGRDQARIDRRDKVVSVERASRR